MEGKEKYWNRRYSARPLSKIIGARLMEEDIMAEMQKPVPMSLFTWQGVKETTTSPLIPSSIIWQYLNAGFLPLIFKWKNSGLVGGIEHDFFQFDHVKETTKRQVDPYSNQLYTLQRLKKVLSRASYLRGKTNLY